MSGCSPLSNHPTYLPYMSGSVTQCSEVKWLQRKCHSLNHGKNISFFSNFANFLSFHFHKHTPHYPFEPSTKNNNHGSGRTSFPQRGCTGSSIPNDGLAKHTGCFHTHGDADRLRENRSRMDGYGGSTAIKRRKNPTHCSNNWTCRTATANGSRNVAT